MGETTCLVLADGRPSSPKSCPSPLVASPLPAPPRTVPAIPGDLALVVLLPASVAGLDQVALAQDVGGGDDFFVADEWQYNIAGSDDHVLEHKVLSDGLINFRSGLILGNGLLSHHLLLLLCLQLLLLLFLDLGLFGGSGRVAPGGQQAGPELVGIFSMLICNVTIKVIGGGGFYLTEKTDMGRLFLVMGATEVFHEMRLLPETVQAKDALIRSHSGVGPQVNVDVGLGG